MYDLCSRSVAHTWSYLSAGRRFHRSLMTRPRLPVKCLLPTAREGSVFSSVCLFIGGAYLRRGGLSSGGSASRGGVCPNPQY